jgi:hypothetical protein
VDIFRLRLVEKREVYFVDANTLVLPLSPCLSASVVLSFLFYHDKDLMSGTKKREESRTGRSEVYFVDANTPVLPLSPCLSASVPLWFFLFYFTK